MAVIDQYKGTMGSWPKAGGKPYPNWEIWDRETGIVYVLAAADVGLPPAQFSAISIGPGGGPAFGWDCKFVDGKTGLVATMFLRFGVSRLRPIIDQPWSWSWITKPGAMPPPIGMKMPGGKDDPYGGRDDWLKDKPDVIDPWANDSPFKEEDLPGRQKGPLQGPRLPGGMPGVEGGAGGWWVDLIGRPTSPGSRRNDASGPPTSAATPGARDGYDGHQSGSTPSAADVHGHGRFDPIDPTAVSMLVDAGINDPGPQKIMIYEDPNVKTPDPNSQSNSLTGNPAIDDAILRDVRFQLGFLSAPIGPIRALTPDGSEVDYVDMSAFNPNDLDPLGPVINWGDGDGRRRYPRNSSQGSLENPYIEALYPDGSNADWNAPAFDPTSPPESPRPPDPAAIVGSYSAGVRSPTIDFVAASARNRSRSAR
jgi:hypothetical protein